MILGCQSNNQYPEWVIQFAAGIRKSHHGIKSMHIALVGPLPPPFGGMANQTRQLAALLEAEGIEVELIRTNEPFRPLWAARIKGVRAMFRLVPYICNLWRGIGKVRLVHIMANSGWSWHLFAAPAIWMAWWLKVPVVVNYRGGEAEPFLQSSIRWVRPSLQRTACIVVPSEFLRAIFNRFGIDTEIIPNIIDLERFSFRGDRKSDSKSPHLIICRNLERIYDVATGLKAFSGIVKVIPGARLSVAGEGPERLRLEALAGELGIDHCVTFVGRLDLEGMRALYESADLMLNASRVDNMPNALLEAMSAGVPIVTTDAGGIPYMVKNGESALITQIGNWSEMAELAVKVLGDPGLYALLSANGRQNVKRYRWESVRQLWINRYTELDKRTGNNSQRI